MWSKNVHSVLFHRRPCSVDRPESLLKLVKVDVGGLKIFVVGGVGFGVLRGGKSASAVGKRGFMLMIAMQTPVTATPSIAPSSIADPCNP